MRVYTAQIGRGGSGLILDTTVKSGAGLGKVLAPTWDIVWGVKKGQISHEEYDVALVREPLVHRQRFRIGVFGFDEFILAHIHVP